MERAAVQGLQKTAWFGRIAIVFIYVYFGVLKIIGASPAEEIVTQLHAHTVPFIPINAFLVLLGAVEVAIGLLFLWPKITKIAISIFLIHMFTTILPLAVLPHTSWSSFGVPTLAGQYILKNVALIALVSCIIAINTFVIKQKNYGTA
ncbi:MAG: hypothetical protein WCT27_03500 [Patescibacteria group bacterium]|jgi:hypothetical protein